MERDFDFLAAKLADQVFHFFGLQRKNLWRNSVAVGEITDDTCFCMNASIVCGREDCIEENTLKWSDNACFIYR